MLIQLQTLIVRPAREVRPPSVTEQSSFRSVIDSGLAA